MIQRNNFISVVTPTLKRPQEVIGLLENLSVQTLLPAEVILIDGADAENLETEKIVRESLQNFPFRVTYLRKTGGTAIQRNHGIDAAEGDFIAFIDDDVRLKSDFFEKISEAFISDEPQEIGGIVGYRANEFFAAAESARWRWYKKLKLLTVFEPGRYDFACGYPINSSLQPPFAGIRKVDFMTTACAVWRRKVFAGGLRFDEFFRDYGVLEDAHLSLRAGREWILLQHGEALCEELRSPNGRTNANRIGYKCVVNYYFVFQDIVQPLSFAHKFRFWRYQIFEIFRVGASAVRRRQWRDAQEVFGRFKGIFAVFSGVINSRNSAKRKPIPGDGQLTEEKSS